MARFCLIGKKLGHSLSPEIHNAFGYEYDLVELLEDEVENFVKRGDYDGFNVTIPYKKVVMEYIDVLDDTAKAIGAVNTVVRRDGLLYGYNTDVLGMEYSFSFSGIDLKDRAVMILGTGGTSLTAKYLAEKKGAKSVVVVSRTGEVNYSNYTEYKDTEVVINTTPVGMYPNVEGKLVDLDNFPEISAGFDPIYNPLRTDFIWDVMKKGVPCSNGLRMLVAQAKFARDLFLGDKASDDIIEKVYKELHDRFENIVLIGMPGCGKSTIGKLLSDKLNKKFVDIDEEIVKRAEISIPEIFEKYGEERFRDLESEAIEKICAERGEVVSFGGGAVKREKNIHSAKRNGIVVYIKRDIDKLAREGRPLSKDKESVKRLYDERRALYERYADITVENDGRIEDATSYILEELYEDTFN